MTQSIGNIFKQLIMTLAQLPPLKGEIIAAQKWQEKDTVPASRKTLLLCRYAALTIALIGGLEFTLSFSGVQDAALRLVIAFSGIAFIFMGTYISAIAIMAKKPRTMIVQNAKTTPAFKISLFLYSATFFLIVIEANPFYAIALILLGLMLLYLYQKRTNKNV